MQQIEKFCVTCKYVTYKRHFDVVAGVDEAVFNFTYSINHVKSVHNVIFVNICK